MSGILGQVVFLAAYILLVITLRAIAQESLRRRDQREFERQEALRREWAVGIPYDPNKGS